MAMHQRVTRRLRTSGIAVLGAVAIGAGGLMGGAALARGLVDDSGPPAGIAAVPGGAPAPAIKPNYPRNSSGQSYGPTDDAIAVENEPDLILVVATNGSSGYVSKIELDEITGANISSPEEAIAWQSRQDAAGWTTKSIPVYELDGTTVIGEFEISRSVADPANAG